MTPSRIAWVALLCGVSACTEDSATPLAIERVGPRPIDGVRTLFLNQPLVVEFSAPLDPDSVRAPAFRVFDDGGPIDGEVEVRDRTLWFRPRAPIGAALEDGSFRPGRTVQLELAGLPRSAAIRDLDGHALSASYIVTFQVPDRAPGGDGRELFLDTSVGTPMALRLDLDPPRLSLGSRELVLDFTHPPLPTTVTPSAFVLQRLPRDGKGPVPVRVEGAEVLPRWLPDAREPGTSVRLDLEPGLQDADAGPLFLGFAQGSSQVLRDLSGRPVRPLDPPAIAIATPRLAWRELGLQAVGDAPGFQLDDGQPVPRTRLELGDGSARRFVAGRSPLLRRSDLEFRSFVVPAGQRAVLDLEGRPAVLRSLGAVRIDGELEVRNAPVGVAWSESERPSVAAVARDASFAIFAGGTLRVGGRLVVRSVEAPERAASVALVAVDRVDVEGEVPYGALMSVEPGGFTLGAAEGPVSHNMALSRGAAAGARAVWKARTGWWPLPVAGSGQLVFRLEHPPELSVAVELEGPGVRGRVRPFTDGEVVCPLGDATDFRLLLETEAPNEVSGSAIGSLSVRLR